MSQGEAQRYAVIERVVQGHASQAVAAQQLGLSVRQIKRLCAGVRVQGSAGVISKRRGQSSNRRIGAERKSAIMGIVAQHYGDFGPQLACEYLTDVHGQAIGVETLRGWMIEARLWQARRRRKARQHPSGPRRDRLGELVQIDGSHHDGFEAHADKCCLIAFIDDASVQVLAARLSPTETTQAYFAVAPRSQQDAHRPFTGTAQQLARICALHHQHQLSAQLSCQFEGSQLWITPGQAHAPKGKVRVDIAEHGDGALEVLWRGQVLAHRAYTLHEHLRGKRTLDDKTINQRVDALARQQRHIAPVCTPSWR